MRTVVRAAPLRWFGGKQSGGKADWISGILPWCSDSVYCEPFGGMMSVLLRRRAVKCEIFNDLNRDVVNWWRVVREDRDRFGLMVESTPHSRVEFERGCEILNGEFQWGTDRAWAFHTVVCQDIASSPERQYWASTKSVSAGSMGRWRQERVGWLAERIWNVQLECRDGLDLLEWMTDQPDAVIYCDPPYYSSHTKLHRHGDVDQARMEDLLLGQKGRVAVSGYGDEWDGLGWVRYERESAFSGVGKPMSKKESEMPRMEVLWCNYQPEQERKSLTLFDQ